MPNRNVRNAKSLEERRESGRWPIDEVVRYKILGWNNRIEHVGSGKTLNMSGCGALFTTESCLPEGVRIELAVSWPAKLNGVQPLKLVATGRLVRTEATQAAMSFKSYELKTRRLGLSPGL